MAIDIIGVNIGVNIGDPCYNYISGDPENVTVEYHVVNLGDGPDYSTLCGIDAEDETIGHYGTVKPRKGQKVTCERCKAIYFGVKGSRLRKNNFE